MPRKSNARKAASASRQVGSQSTESSIQFAAPGFFPFARYISIVGVHTSLLAFTALFLPHASRVPQASTSAPFLQGLTSSPAVTLAWICAGAIPLQGWWAGWVRKWSIEFSIEGTDAEKRIERNERDKDKFTKLRNAWLATFVTSFGIHAVVVLFGAPLLSHYLHTYLLACLISLLTAFTPVYTLGLPSFASDSKSLVTRLTWTRLFAELSPRTAVERAIVYPVVGTAVGSWAGAFPIALDWDRPWQAWPLTPAYAAILGYILGSLSALCVSTIQTLATEENNQSQSSRKAKVS
jgi:phosphatidylinositol glycan class F